jgi:hypothetical protein
MTTHFAAPPLVTMVARGVTGAVAAARSSGCPIPHRAPAASERVNDQRQ